MDGYDNLITAPLEQVQAGGVVPAGSARGALTWVDSGTVQIDDQASDWLGAPGHTNNTGELSAMFYALERAGKRPAGVGHEIIHTDSLYALNMTRGKWMPRAKGKRNAPLIERLRKLWRRIQRTRPGEVTLRHVRSHIQVPGNELADWLAERGALSRDPTPLDHATSWMRAWLLAISGF